MEVLRSNVAYTNNTEYRTSEIHRETLRTQDMDAVVVGMGVLGLMLAKRLTDFGQRVAIIEQSSSIANGPSIKNHGWLHTGIVHSLSSQDTPDNKLVKKLQYGHDFFTNYAPECIDEPFEPTYAITKDATLAQRARERWERFGVPHKEISSTEFLQVETNIDPYAASYFFETNDSRVNNRLLFAKLQADIRHRGAAILRAYQYEYEDDRTIVVSDGVDVQRIQANLFFYATGNNLGEAYNKLTDEELQIEYWKSHLLILPRITEASIVNLDRHSPIIINHGNTSIVNRSYDEIPIKTQDTTVDSGEVERAFDVLARDYPNSRRFANQLRAIACLKPHISTDTSTTRHSVGEVVLEPKEGHIFALPGKMTEAPYIADMLMKRVYEKLNLDSITKRPMDEQHSPTLYT